MPVRCCVVPSYRPLYLLLSAVILILTTTECWSGQKTTNDGSRSAPAGTPQLPTLLKGYAARPPWMVAGVDYAVGSPTGVVLKSPRSGLPAGATYDARDELVRVTGSNVTLDGYDFGSKTVLITKSASGTITIKNSVFLKGRITSTVDATAGLVVANCVLDGGGMASSPDFRSITVWSPLTVEYCWIKDSMGGIYASAPLTVQYNVFQGFGWNSAAHANAIYVVGGNNPSHATVIAYNTIYSETSRNSFGFPIGIGAAIAFFDDGGSFYNSEVSHNTLISAMSGAASYLIGFYVTSPYSATGGNVHDNYLYWTNGGAFGAFYTGSRGAVSATYTRNINIANEKVINGDNTEAITSAPSRSETEK